MGRDEARLASLMMKPGCASIPGVAGSTCAIPYVEQEPMLARSQTKKGPVVERDEARALTEETSHGTL